MKIKKTNNLIHDAFNSLFFLILGIGLVILSSFSQIGVDWENIIGFLLGFFYILISFWYYLKFDRRFLKK